MAPATVQSVSESFSRVRRVAFARAFYDRFLAADPDVRLRFAKTDFERQQELFLHGVFALIDYAGGRATGVLALRRLATLHGRERLAIPPRLYDLWIQHLLATLAAEDPAWRPELADAWREVMTPGIDVLKRG